MDAFKNCNLRLNNKNRIQRNYFILLSISIYNASFTKVVLIIKKLHLQPRLTENDENYILQAM